METFRPIFVSPFASVVTGPRTCVMVYHQGSCPVLKHVERLVSKPLSVVIQTVIGDAFYLFRCTWQQSVEEVTLNKINAMFDHILNSAKGKTPTIQSFLKLN